MNHVICNHAGKHHLCKQCGAAKPHYHTSCEPCPIDTQAHCEPFKFETDNLAIPIIKNIEELRAARAEDYKQIKVICPGCSGTFFRTIDPAEKILLNHCKNHQ